MRPIIKISIPKLGLLDRYKPYLIEGPVRTYFEILMEQFLFVNCCAFLFYSRKQK